MGHVIESPDPHLLERILSRDNMQKAWRRVKANRGAAGVDNMSVADFPAYARTHWESIRASVLAGTYQPLPVKRVEIAKPTGGTRPLGIPCVTDRLIQQAIAQVLCRRADLLVLDEPTAGLDFAGKKLFELAMRAELDRGASLITATHDIQEAMVCDQTMLLARRVVAIGAPHKVLTPEALMETFGIVLDLKTQELRLAVLDRECGHDCVDRAGKV